MSVDVLSAPFEAPDAWMAGLLAGAPMLVAAGFALVLGLRHASDPDHLVAVSSMIVRDGAGVDVSCVLRRQDGALSGQISPDDRTS